MKPKYFLLCLFICLVLLPSFAAASNWILFASQQRNTVNWYYDKESLEASREIKVFGKKIPPPPSNVRKMWIKSSQDKVEKFYQAELSCKEGLARLRDDGGKIVYSDASINYLYNRPIPPDSVLDILRKAVCSEHYFSW